MRRVLLSLGMATICLALLPAVAHAQIGPEPVIAEWAVSNAPEGGWTVGDRIPLRLSATYPADLEVILPELPEAWGPFEVLEQALLEPVEREDGMVTAARQATVTLWAPGDYQTPPLAVRYRDADDQLHETLVPPLSITVVSVLSEGDTEKRDLKPQASLPRAPLWPWVLGGLLLAALVGVAGWLLLTRLRHRTALATTTAPFDLRPPEEIAYSELDHIAALDLPTQGELKRHYTLVADCMRSYVEGRYHLPALDRTTRELAAAFRQAHVDRGHITLLRDLLAEADLVKFAKARPPIGQARAAIDRARHIVDVTKLSNSETRDSGIRDSEIRLRPESQNTKHETRNT
jgi:hypothetical protein